MLFVELRLKLFVVVFRLNEIIFKAVESRETYRAENCGDDAHEGALLLESEGEGEDVNNVSNVNKFVLETLGRNEMKLLFIEIVLRLEDLRGLIISMITIPNRKTRPKHTNILQRHHDVWIVNQGVAVEDIAQNPYNDKRERKRDEPRPMNLFLLREPLFKIVHQSKIIYKRVGERGG